MLVFLMLTCGAWTIGILIGIVLPEWHSGVITAVILFIVIDRLYLHKRLKLLSPLSSEWLVALGTQWIVILIFVRLLLSYANGLASFLKDMSLFARGYLANLFTIEFVFSVLLVLLFWYLSGQFLELLDEVGLNQALALSEESIYIQHDMVPAHQRLANLIFSMGIVLVILASLTRINLPTLFSNPVGISNLVVKHFSGGEAGALLYFVFGLALLSLSRLMSLQTHWNQMRIRVSSSNLTRQWGIYSLIFLIMLAVIVSLLPSGSSMGFLSVLGTLFDFLFSVLFFAAQLFIVLIVLLISIPFRLLGRASPWLNGLTVPPPPALPEQSETLIAGSTILVVIRSILLWGGLIVIIVFSFIHFVKQHDRILSGIRNLRVTNWLILAWQWLFRNADRTRDNLSRVITDGWKSIVARLEGKRLVPRPGLISLKLRDPRRQIYFYYLAMIRRGGEQGVIRKPSQTPSEYAVRLETALPSADEDIDSITEAFMQARYSRLEVSSSDANKVKAIWGRIRRALQRISKSEQTTNK